MARLYQLFLAALVATLAASPIHAQTSTEDYDSESDERRARPEANTGEMMATVSGIGIDRYQPPLNKAATTDGAWTNVNLLLYVLELQAGWGVAEADVSKLPADRYGGTFVGTPGVPVYGRYYAAGINMPIAAKKFGIASARPGSLVRAHFFGAFSIGAINLWDGDRENKTSFAFATLAPGVRVYNNFLTAELRMQGRIGLGTGEYDEYISKVTISPMLTLRANGMFNRIVRGAKLVGSTSYSISDVKSSSTTDRIRRPDGEYERTTTTTSATVSSSRGSSLLADIGRYVGIGPRIAFTRPFAEAYAESSFLVGVGAQMRNGKLLLGLNAEHGRAGHASITRLRGEDKRKIDRSADYARGHLNTTNVFADLGLDISSLAKGLLLFTADDDNNVTTFASLNFGYSLGYSIVGGQQFYNDSLATATLTSLERGRTDWETTKRTDPRESSSGIVGGFFMGFDVGAVGFRAQWYRYKGAPLANNTYYTLTYRLFSNRGRR